MIPILVAIILGIPATIAAVLAHRASVRSKSNGEGIQQIHVLVDGSHSRLLEEIAALRKMLVGMGYDGAPPEAQTSEAGTILEDEKQQKQ